MVQIPKNPCPAFTRAVQACLLKTCERAPSWASKCFSAANAALRNLCYQIKNAQWVKKLSLREYVDLKLLDKDKNRVPPNFYGFRVYRQVVLSARWDGPSQYEYSVTGLSTSTDGYATYIDEWEINQAFNSVSSDYVTDHPEDHFSKDNQS